MSSYDIVEDDDAMCPSSSRLFSASPFSLLLASSLKTLRVHDARAFPLSRLPSFAVVVARVIARVVLEDQFCADEEEDGHLPAKVVTPALFENATLRCCASKISKVVTVVVVVVRVVVVLLFAASPTALFAARRIVFFFFFFLKTFFSFRVQERRESVLFRVLNGVFFCKKK